MTVYKYLKENNNQLRLKKYSKKAKYTINRTKYKLILLDNLVQKQINLKIKIIKNTIIILNNKIIKI